jgi:hypothetical protein
MPYLVIKKTRREVKRTCKEREEVLPEANRCMAREK